MKRAEPVRDHFRTADLETPAEPARPARRRNRNGPVTTTQIPAFAVAWELAQDRDVRIKIVSADEVIIVNRRDR